MATCPSKPYFNGHVLFAQNFLARGAAAAGGDRFSVRDICSRGGSPKGVGLDPRSSTFLIYATPGYEDLKPDTAAFGPYIPMIGQARSLPHAHRFLLGSLSPYPLTLTYPVDGICYTALSLRLS